MCVTCATETPWTPVGGRRLKLWELETSWYCTIIGTCLSMGELRRLAARQDVVFPRSNPTDYEMHTGMIRLASQERPLAKAMTKLLDQKHAGAIGRFRRASTATELETLWRQALDKGEVAGACWALMTHPATTEQLRSIVFGEIHMLSHQVGAAARVDLKRFHALQTENVALEGKVERQQARMKEEIGTRDMAIRDLQDRLDLEIAECRRFTHAAGAAAELAAMKNLVAELKRQVTGEIEARQAAEKAAGDAQYRLIEAERDNAALREDLVETHAELTALEGNPPCDTVAVCDFSCRRPDLCGRCILYVGGRPGHLQHMRRLVEERNGTLVHHDGGFEESMGRLSGLLSQADTVMFPVDCVSHMAHDHLKRLCKRWEKPFVPVRRSGLGAFMRALEGVGHPMEAGAA